MVGGSCTHGMTGPQWSKRIAEERCLPLESQEAKKETGRGSE